MSKNKSMAYQVKGALSKQLRIRESRHRAKQEEGRNTAGIFSWSTYNNYVKHCTAFAEWARKEYGCRTIEQARQYVPEYLRIRMEKGLSAWTVKLDASAIAKLYQCRTTEFGIITPERKRADIKRSRGAADSHFSEDNNRDVVLFGRGTGVRRHEMAALRKRDVYWEEGTLYIHVEQGKGGKRRNAPVRPEYTEHVWRMAERADKPDDYIFSKREMPNRLPEHRYRAEYAKEMYLKVARPVEELAKGERYVCRKDKKGTVYDRDAMLMVSRYMGHNRVDVIAYSYLH